MAHEPEHEQDSGRGLALETAKPEVARPPLFQVLLLNDDFTPMDFVVEVLRTFFSLDQEQAVQVMLHVHTRGRGRVRRVYPRSGRNQGNPRQRIFTFPSAPIVVHYGKALSDPILCSLRR